MSESYKYTNYSNRKVLSVDVYFIQMTKEVVGYDKGISIGINAFTLDKYDNKYTITKFSYPSPIHKGKVLWHPLFKIEEEFKIDVVDLKKFCEKIVKLKVFE